jgi:hypothetical protein
MSAEPCRLLCIVPLPFMHYQSAWDRVKLSVLGCAVGKAREAACSCFEGCHWVASWLCFRWWRHASAVGAPPQQ